MNAAADIPNLRVQLQAIFDNPQNLMEQHFKRDVLDKGSQPHEWYDDIVQSAGIMLTVYQMGWNARNADSSPQSDRTTAKLLHALKHYVHPFQEQFTYTEMSRIDLAREAIEIAEPGALDVAQKAAGLPRRR